MLITKENILMDVRNIIGVLADCNIVPNKELVEMLYSPSLKAQMPEGLFLNNIIFDEFERIKMNPFKQTAGAIKNRISKSSVLFDPIDKFKIRFADVGAENYFTLGFKNEIKDMCGVDRIFAAFTYIGKGVIFNYRDLSNAIGVDYKYMLQILYGCKGKLDHIYLNKHVCILNDPKEENFNRNVATREFDGAYQKKSVDGYVVCLIVKIIKEKCLVSFSVEDLAEYLNYYLSEFLTSTYACHLSKRVIVALRDFSLLTVDKKAMGGNKKLLFTPTRKLLDLNLSNVGSFLSKEVN